MGIYELLSMTGGLCIVAGVIDQSICHRASSFFGPSFTRPRCSNQSTMSSLRSSPKSHGPLLTWRPCLESCETLPSSSRGQAVERAGSGASSLGLVREQGRESQQSWTSKWLAMLSIGRGLGWFGSWHDTNASANEMRLSCFRCLLNNKAWQRST